MGVDLYSVLMDLYDQPELRHQWWLALLLIQGWTLTLRVAAATIVAFNRSRGDTKVCITLLNWKQPIYQASTALNQQNSPCMSESRLPWLETTLCTLLGLSLPQPEERKQVYLNYTTYKNQDLTQRRVFPQRGQVIHVEIKYSK